MMFKNVINVGKIPGKAYLKLIKTVGRFNMPWYLERYVNYLKKHGMDIEGMHCKNCAMHIENAFNEQPDCMAKVDLAGKFARIYTKKPVEEVVLKQTVWRAGYEPKTVTVEK